MSVAKFLPSALKQALKRILSKRSISMSQAGQDRWVYGEVFNEKRDGICVEANPVLFEQLKKNRSSLCLNLCLDRSEGEVDFALNDDLSGIVDEEIENERNTIEPVDLIRLKTTTLMKVLADHDAPDIVDYLSIDVEGAEERILSGFDFEKYLFRCITIERPTQLLRDLLMNQNYVLIKEIPGLDCFYVHQSFIKEYLKNLFSFSKKKHWGIRWK